MYEFHERLPILKPEQDKKTGKVTLTNQLGFRKEYESWGDLRHALVHDSEYPAGVRVVFGHGVEYVSDVRHDHNRAEYLMAELHSDYRPNIVAIFNPIIRT